MAASALVSTHARILEPHRILGSLLTCWLCQVILTLMSVVSVDALPADPLAALRELTRGEAELEAVRRAKVEAARDAGASWEQVGEALGVSRQSAWEYYSSAIRLKLASNVEANADLSEADAMDLAVEEVRAVRRRRRRS